MNFRMPAAIPKMMSYFIPYWIFKAVAFHKSFYFVFGSSADNFCSYIFVRAKMFTDIVDVVSKGL